MKRFFLAVMTLFTLFFYACPFEDAVCEIAKDRAKTFANFTQNNFDCNPDLVYTDVMKPFAKTFCKNEMGFANLFGVKNPIAYIACKVGVGVIAKGGGVVAHTKYGCSKEKIEDLIKRVDFFCSLLKME